MPRYDCSKYQPKKTYSALFVIIFIANPFNHEDQ